MFSGIIQTTSPAFKIDKNYNSMRATFPIPKKWKLEVGESINIDGVCSTIEKLTKQEFSVFYMPETLSKTALSHLPANHVFNLERCLTLNTLIGGHLVSGHVDTTAEVMNVKNEQDSRVVKFKLHPKFMKYLIYKGSIAINGVSLTVVEENKTFFTVSLIPFTLTHTNLGELTVGDKVNIEVDLIGKYLGKLAKK